MPLQTDPYPPDLATPWFANLLPEDRQLEQIGLLLHRSQADVYGLLEEMGGETAGALSIGMEQLIEKAKYEALDDEQLAATIERLPERPMLAGEPEITMSLAGGQSKLAVALFEGKVFLPLNGAASTHILKPENERLFATVENELLCMRLAATLGLSVARTTMGITDKRRYLLVERYDRTIIGDRQVIRQHQEDFCQALGYYPTEKYEARRGPGFGEIFGTVTKHVRQSARDRLRYLIRLFLLVA
jgi:serine/threonine-protein kinase HipA